MIGESLHIVVCVKHTPAATGVLSFDPATGEPKSAQWAMNPFDEYALEEGVRIKEQLGGKAVVTVLTLGAPTATDAIRDAIARGADGGVLLSSPDFAGGDTYATASALAAAIRRLSKDRGPVDLVLFGKQTNDSDTGQVGQQVAALLDVPGAAFVRKVAEVGGGKITVERMMEDGADVLEMDLPAAVSVTKEINEPRIASLKGKMASKKAAIPTWGPAELGAEASAFGRKGSLALYGVPYMPPKRSGGVAVDGASPQEKAKKLLAALKERKLI